MDVRIEHNGIDISSYVISYTRESKICTGIATLEMELAYTYTTAILPWDTISIIEGGSRVATFYVGQVTDSQPGAVITINAQDNSKRLTDYFITENYTVDRRSNAKKWITKFLNEAGVDWKYTVSGHGGVLTNNTTMGMQSAYEQVMTLLQLSGWYIRFDEYGKAFIGELSTVPPNFSTVDYVNFPSSGIFTGTGNLSGYGDFPCSGIFTGLGLITGHEVVPQAGIFLLDSTFTGEGDITGSGTFPCAGIFHGNGFYIGAGTFPGNGTFSGNGNFTDSGVYPGYSDIDLYGTFTCYGTYPKVGTRLDNDVIIDIKVDKNDRMYRNRVVVWGNGNEDTGGWVFADVSLIGNKWDYDANDRRTIVIANSNIPDAGDAFELANKALMEFGKLTVEKRITAIGALPIKVGDIVLVINDLFTGNGRVTSFGVSMSKAGLISNIVLDERCPRLFGYYHPRIVEDPFIPSGTLGYAVYVSTFGDGVWRKTNSGINESGWAGSMWEDYSSGLEELEVTDLHVNNGALVNVTSAGDSYSSLEANGYWEKINLNSLSVTVSGTTESYSDLKARACIIDRDSNSLRIAVDNFSGINYGDFLMDTDPFNMLRSSGYIIGDRTSMRSWVVEASPNGAYVTDSHPVNYSGSYDFFVTDIANDGTYDYVEAVTLGYGTYPPIAGIGIYEGANYDTNIVYDSRMPTYMAYSGVVTPIEQQPDEKSWSFNYTTDGDLSIYDNLSAIPPTDSFVARAAWQEDVWHNIIGYYTLQKIWYDEDGDLRSTHYSLSSTACPDIKVLNVVRIKKISDYIYDYYVIQNDILAGTDTLYRVRTDFLSETADSVTVVSGIPNAAGTGCWDTVDSGYDEITIGDIQYRVRCIGKEYFDFHVSLYHTYAFDIYLNTLNLITGETTSDLIVSKDTSLVPGSDCTGYTAPQPRLFQHGVSSVRLICPYLEMKYEYELYFGGDNWIPYTVNLSRISYDLDTESDDDALIFDWAGTYGATSYNAYALYYSNEYAPYWIQGNFNTTRQYYRYTIGRIDGVPEYDIPDDSLHMVVDTFDSFTVTYEADSDSLSQYSKIYNIRGITDDAVGEKPDGVFCFIDPETGDQIADIVPQTFTYIDEDGDTITVDSADIELVNHEGVVDSFNGDHFYKARLDSAGKTIALSKSNVITRLTWEFDADPENMFGNFRVSDGSAKYVVPGVLDIMYPIFVLFARDGDDYILLKSGIYQERVEVSEYYPIITMDRRVSSLESRLITMDGQIQLSTHPAMIGYNIPNSTVDFSIFSAGITSDDFKYADFSRVAESGLSREILVVYSGGVGSIDAINLTSFSGLYTTYSGVATRIETTNYQLPDQYLFLSVSGDAGDMSFFQRDPSSGVWVDYSSGYPQSRTTQIRIDDSI